MVVNTSTKVVFLEVTKMLFLAWYSLGLISYFQRSFPLTKL